MKVYIHHKYNKPLFFRFAHNTTNRVFFDNETNGDVEVECEYKGKKIKFIFTEEFNNNEDSFHIIDYYEAVISGKIMKEWVKFYTNVLDIPFLQLVYHLIGKEKNWIITMTRTEKLFSDSTTSKNFHMDSLEAHMKKISNHRFVHDNYFIDKNIHKIYQNNYYAFTNTVMQWNQNISIRYYYEFKSVFERLN